MLLHLYSVAFEQDDVLELVHRYKYEEYRAPLPNKLSAKDQQ